MRWWFLQVALLVGCGKHAAPTSAASDTNENQATSHVQIDLTDEDQELSSLDGIELKAVTADCGNILDLEPAARLGRLSEDQIRCLDTGYGHAERQTAKDKISRVLLADAWAKGDIHRWMSLAARHLEQVDRADPDLVYEYTYHLVEIGNPDKMDEAVHWAEVALENKSYWEGDLHVRRVYGLYKIRTLAEVKKWQYLESQYKTKPSDKLNQAVEKARNDVKTYAREWLDYAKSAGRDTSEPLHLCSMAAGTDEFCSADG